MARVLLVEDDGDLREALSDALIDAGYVVTHAGNGRTALALLQQGPDFSLIILDLMLPEMDGWQFRHEMSKDARFKDVPVIVVSAHGADAPCGAHAYLKKPV